MKYDLNDVSVLAAIRSACHEQMGKDTNPVRKQGWANLANQLLSQERSLKTEQERRQAALARKAAGEQPRTGSVVPKPVKAPPPDTTTTTPHSNQDG